MNRLYFLAIMLLTSVSFMAQPAPNRPTKENVFARKWEFLSTRAVLSAQEAAKVQPLFVDFEEQIWQLYAGNREIFRMQRKSQSQQKIDFEAINDAMIETELTKANLQKEYYLKLKKVLDAETINKLLHAEKAYQREMIQRIPDRGTKPEGVGKNR